MEKEIHFNNESNDAWELENNTSEDAPLVDNKQPTSTEIVPFSQDNIDMPFPENSTALPDLISFIQLTEEVLKMSAGHNSYQARKIAYYILGTWHLSHFDPFPGLVFYGAPSTGKTASMNVCKELCCKAVTITSDSITEAAFKQTMADANNGTLIVEEADKVTERNLESLLIARYSKSSAHVSKMVKLGGDWVKSDLITFGASVLHRRILFRDPALLRRMIKVKTMRKKKKFSKIPPGVLKQLLKKLYVVDKFPVVDNAWDIEAGIFDCYLPLVRIAKYFSDEVFLNRLIEEMKQESNQLKEEETYLEGPTLLKAFIRLAADKFKDNPTAERFGIHVKEINPAIREEFGPDNSALLLSPNQRNRIIREDFKFLVTSGDGKNKVYLTLPMLISVCEEHSITDDVFAVWKEKLNLK